MEAPQSGAYTEPYHTVIITIGAVTDGNYNNLSAERIKKEYIFDLTHEISHQIGAPDHYCYGPDETGKCRNAFCDRCQYGTDPRFCFMTDRMEWPFDPQTIYCNDCKNEIMTHLSSHH